MNRDDVSWHGYWPACPTPFHADRSLDLDSLRALARVLHRRGRARDLRQRDDRGVVLADAGRAAAGRRDRDRPGRGPGPGRRRAARPTPRARRSSSAVMRSRPAPSGIGSTPPPYSQDVPRRDRRVLPRHLATASTGRSWSTTGRTAASVDIGPTSRAGSPTSTTSSRSRTARRTRAVLRDGRSASSTASASSARSCRVEGFELPARARRRRVHRRRLAVRGARRRSSGRRTGAATTSSAARTPCAPTGCSRSSGCPAAGAGQYGAYQSQLKAIMKMLGQPGGEVRGARDCPCPTRRASRAIGRSWSRSRLLPETVEAA